MAAKKTAAQVEQEHADRVIKAGGAKGEAIVALILSTPGLTRNQVAEQVGCTVGRVGESVRWLAANGTAEEKKAVAAMTQGRAPKAEKSEPKAPVAKKTTAKKAPAKAAPAKAAEAEAKPARSRRRGMLPTG